MKLKSLQILGILTLMAIPGGLIVLTIYGLEKLLRKKNNNETNTTTN